MDSCLNQDEIDVSFIQSRPHDAFVSCAKSQDSAGQNVYKCESSVATLRTKWYGNLHEQKKSKNLGHEGLAVLIQHLIAQNALRR